MLEGGFDRHDRFFFIPLGANADLTELWRHRVIAMFLDKGLLNPDFARKLLHGSHSGFSIDSGTRIYDENARRSLSQYIVRAPLSLTRIHWDQDRDTLTWKAAQKGYFKGKERHFSCLDFIAQLTLHIPPRGRHLLRRYRGSRMTAIRDIPAGKPEKPALITALQGILPSRLGGHNAPCAKCTRGRTILYIDARPGSFTVGSKSLLFILLFIF